MMPRAKWLIIEVDCTHKAFVSAIRSTQFSDDLGYGFDLSFRDGQRLKARYSEKISSVETVVDPFGVSNTIETTRYISIDFQLIISPGVPSRYFMEVRSPPRTLRSLIAALAEAGRGISVSEVNISLLNVFSLLRKKSLSARLTRIKASQLKISVDSVAKIDVASSKNAASDLLHFLGEKTINVDKIRVEQPFGPSAHWIEVGQTGMISVDEAHEEIASNFVLDLLLEESRLVPDHR